MAENGYNISSAVLPSLFGEPGNAMRDVIGLRERDKERQAQIDYRNQKDVEADQWKKLGLIQDLTDLSKHQTASDVANAIGNQTAADIFQKYTKAATTMSPVELQANIQKDMSGAIQGMEGVKSELESSDAQLRLMKQQYPDLDIGALGKDIRTDVLHRRLDNSGGFQNPLTVPQTQMDLTNPDLLSNYVSSDKTLRNYFQNPQGMDELSVYKGTPNQYTKYTAKVPSFKKPNFDAATLQGGFMTTKGEPQLQYKSSTLPSDALPASKGQPFEMMDKEVLDQLPGMERIALVKSTKQQFPTYDKMNHTEKEYAQRHTLLQVAKNFDQTQFHPTEVHTPSAALLKLNMGTGASGLNVNDLYGRIEDKIDKDVSNDVPTTRFNALDSDEQSVVMDAVNKVAPKQGLDVSNLFLAKKDGKIAVYKTGDNGERHTTAENLITTLPKTGVNLKAQPGVKEKREVIRQGTEKPKKDPLGLFD